MKHLPALLLAGFFLACTAPVAKPAASPAAAGTQAAAAGTTAETDEKSRALAGPWIPVDPKFKVLQVQNLNLDLDPPEEQIICLQSTQDMSLPLVIQIVDFDSQRQTYYLAWEAQGLARANQPFSLTKEDIVGDHSDELVLRGLNEAGFQTLDLLRRVKTLTNAGIQYQSILSLNSRGSIRIEQLPRSQAYESGQKVETSYPVVVEESDPDSKNPLDIIRTTYYWRFQSNQYVSIKGAEKIRRESLGDDKLNALFQGETKALEDYLEGTWYRTDGEAQAGQFAIYFQTRGQKMVTFFNRSAQEDYEWEGTSRTLRNGLYLSGSNAQIPLIRIQMSLAVTAVDTIEVSSGDIPNLTGTYKKLAPSIQAPLYSNSRESQSGLKLPAGLFKNDQGVEITFDLPMFTLKENGKTNSGAASLFVLNRETILQMKIIRDNGLHEELRAYKMIFVEESSNQRTVRTLTLLPGTLDVTGLQLSLADPIKLEQVEIAGH